MLRAISHIRRQPRLGSMSYRFCQNDDRRAGLMMRATTANKYGPPKRRPAVPAGHGAGG